ncbi:GNAT family N-acetyltransferase [Pelagibius sp.]|uniref:GNAT family N-acetyltransferase n=1 Tax=Pelagibius sp. TaxID=1931238 RepID=UPI0026388EA0|nr:GNAT family N-acetyltransferase [Pelagibius sp.]
MPKIAIDFAWGAQGLRALLTDSGLIAIVDVLSFTTAVDVAVSQGAVVLPYPHHDQTAPAFAAEKRAQLAEPRDRSRRGRSLSPASLADFESGAKLVLPSPNGSTLSTLVGDKPTYAACLRNATAVAAALQAAAEARGSCRIAVIAAGERWSDGGLRPALEDLLGAGALITRLRGQRTAGARAAAAAYAALRDDLAGSLRGSASGRELTEKGFGEDLDWAAAEDCSAAVPLLRGGRYENAGAGPAAALHSAPAMTLREGDVGDDAACGAIVGAAASTSAYAPRVPHAAALLGDRSPLSQAGRHRIVAEAGGQVLGFVEFLQDQTEGGGHVKYLFVQPEAQGRGLGDALLAAAEAAIEGTVTLNVLSVNDRGLRWYMRRGYRIVEGNLEEDWEGGPAIWLTLEKRPLDSAGGARA